MLLVGGNYHLTLNNFFTLTYNIYDYCYTYSHKKLILKLNLFLQTNFVFEICILANNIRRKTF